MKRYAPLLLTFLFLPLLFSCFDLEEDLYDQLEKEDYYTDYESLMASVLRPYEHAKWAETNFSFWLQELSADQLVITQKREHWEDGGVWRMIHQHTWDTYKKNSEQMWNACYGGIGYCNNTLADIQELSYDNFGLAESDQAAAYRRAYRFTGLFPTFTSGCVPHPRDLPHDRGRGRFGYPTRKFPLYRRELIKRHPRFTQGTL